MDPVPRAIVTLGVALLALGALLQWAPGIPLLGKLPGDLRIERPGLRLYLPITSCVVVSLLLSGLLSLLSRFR